MAVGVSPPQPPTTTNTATGASQCLAACFHQVTETVKIRLKLLGHDAPVAVLVVVGGCGGETPTATALPSVPVKPEPLPETSAVQAPPIGLTPLPSAEEVQQAAPGGRADPFAPLVGVEAADAQAPRLALP